MAFENPVIDPQSIPQAANIELHVIDARYYKVLVFQQVIFWVTIAVIATLCFVFIPQLQPARVMFPIISGLAFLLLLTSVLSYLSFKYKAYAVREHDIIYRTGWFIQSMHACPFSRIQHCSVNSGIIERKYGLSKLTIYTAGGDEADVTIPGLTRQYAEDLSMLILDRVAQDGAD